MDIIHECNVQHWLRQFNMAKMTRTFCRCISTGGTFLARFKCSKPVIHKSTLHRHTILIIGFWGCYFCDAEFANRSEEHTSELQSRRELVCRLLLEKKNKELVRPTQLPGAVRDLHLR